MQFLNKYFLTFVFITHCIRNTVRYPTSSLSGDATCKQVKYISTNMVKLAGNRSVNF